MKTKGIHAKNRCITNLNDNLYLKETHKEGFLAKIRLDMNDISYLSETQRNNIQFLNEYDQQTPQS